MLPQTETPKPRPKAASPAAAARLQENKEHVKHDPRRDAAKEEKQLDEKGH